MFNGQNDANVAATASIVEALATAIDPSGATMSRTCKILRDSLLLARGVREEKTEAVKLVESFVAEFDGELAR